MLTVKAPKTLKEALASCKASKPLTLAVGAFLVASLALLVASPLVAADEPVLATELDPSFFFPPSKYGKAKLKEREAKFKQLDGKQVAIKGDIEEIGTYQGSPCYAVSGYIDGKRWEVYVVFGKTFKVSKEGKVQGTAVYDRIGTLRIQDAKLTERPR